MQVFILSIVFGIIGMGYFAMGRRRDNMMLFYSGIGLMAYPYFVNGVIKTLLLGIALSVIPFISRYFA
jgi:hypothetical protein